MTRRRPGPGVLPALVSLLAFLSLLTTSTAATQQQLSFKQRQQHQSPQSQFPHHQDATYRPSIPQVSRIPTFEPSHKSFRDTHVNSNDASAVATLALAGIGPSSIPAVRAPSLAKTGTPTAGGLSPQLHARSLQDWEVEDFVLLATVDGSIHARDRKTGAPRWALEVPSSPMVETIYHQANRSGLDLSVEDDYLWIIEPSRDGELYIYSQAPDAGLQKLGITVKKLVDETPYSGEDPAVTYTAKKETTLYTIDAGTGAVLKQFSSRGVPIAEEMSCRKVNGLESDDEECGFAGILSLGRVEYVVAVQNTETGQPICTLKFSEWTPNNRDIDLQSQYFQTMDQRHIYSMADGSILAFDHSKDDSLRYRQRFSSPVARVFDIARPINIDAKEPPLVILPQPPMPSDSQFSSVNVPHLIDQVFVNVTESGGWYAMSEIEYPGVTGGVSRAECSEKDYVGYIPPMTTLALAEKKRPLIGKHSLNGADSGRRTVPSISGPPSDISNDNATPIGLVAAEIAVLPVLQHSVIVRNSVDIIATMIFLFICGFVYLNWPILRKLAKQKLDLKNMFPALDHSLTSPPPTPMVAQGPWAEKASLLTEDGTSSADISAAEFLEAEQVQKSTPVIQVETPVTPPRVRIEEPVVIGDGNEDEDGEPTTPQPGKKKARRGRRGGQAHRRGRKNKESSLDKIVEDVKNIQPDSHLEPDVRLTRTPSHEVIFSDIDSAIQVGQLKVYMDKVLGLGSHGTVVYKGSFDGRDVAVKRMLVEFYDIASHEVGLLQESDDHANVIRYFCREQAAQFLYIALELCPASLQDVVEKPMEFGNLVGNGLNVPDVLYQITAGVRYLHSLKIVHRDLKPQNILVAAPKKAGTGNIRLLISDFGLCKKLEDNQSSFRATTAHAAGTSGWRAPELLVDDDTSTPVVSAMSMDSHNGETSEPAVVDPQTNRRATRAIDIFSLGCVFYYVLTRGSHPFDKNGKFMREANIVKGNCNLDGLQELGDYAFEAEDLIGKMLSLNPKDR